jgi:23S rRNA (guanosine2251-2'-O)-methyltransferase
MYYKRKQSHESLLFGLYAVLENLKARKPLSKLWLQRDLSHPLAQEILALAKAQEVPYSRVPLIKLKEMTQKNHQGVVAWASPIPFVSLEDLLQTTYEKGQAPLLLLLDGITDIRNLGAIARSALAAGIDGLVVGSAGCAPVGGAAMKASAGALAHLPVCRTAELERTIRYLEASGVQLVACTEKATTSFTQGDLRLPTALLLGSEERGIAKELLALTNQQLTIPMQGAVGSLNVSVAAGIFCYEAVRQRTQLG